MPGYGIVTSSMLLQDCAHMSPVTVHTLGKLDCGNVAKIFYNRVQGVNSWALKVDVCNLLNAVLRAELFSTLRHPSIKMPKFYVKAGL